MVLNVCVVFDFSSFGDFIIILMLFFTCSLCVLFVPCLQINK